MVDVLCRENSYELDSNILMDPRVREHDSMKKIVSLDCLEAWLDDRLDRTDS